MLISIKQSSIHGKGIFATENIKQGTRWIFKLEKVCCQSHCFVEGIQQDGPIVYLGTLDWPFYINSTWPDITNANLSLIINADNMTLIITAKQFIEKGIELTLPYNWTTHKDSCYIRTP